MKIVRFVRYINGGRFVVVGYISGTSSTFTLNEERLNNPFNKISKERIVNKSAEGNIFSNPLWFSSILVISLDRA
jgi:hypothetical protein